MLASCGALEGLLEVQGAEALLVPLLPRAATDEPEGHEHEDVPLPPGDPPVDREGDDDHRRREQRERDRDGEDERGRAPVQPQVAERPVP
jgi:hypothetical protein